MKYYLHDSSSFDDEKITELYIKFGYEGLGLFYTLLEKLAKQEKPIKTDVLKHQLKVGKRLNKCWKFMEEMGLISSNNGETFNKQLLNFSESYQIKKEKNAKRISEWRNNQQNTENVTCNESVRNAPKVNISKVKESKVKESKVKVSNYKLNNIKGEEQKKLNHDKHGSPDYLETIINLFKASYLKIRGTDYVITNKGRERSAVGKLLAVYKAKNPDADKEQTANDLERFFEQALDIPDEWLYQNMSLAMLYSKLNEIRTILNNQRPSKKRQAMSKGESAARVLQNFINDEK